MDTKRKNKDFDFNFTTRAKICKSCTTASMTCQPPPRFCSEWFFVNQKCFHFWPFYAADAFLSQMLFYILSRLWKPDTRPEHVVERTDPWQGRKGDCSQAAQLRSSLTQIQSTPIFSKITKWKCISTLKYLIAMMGKVSPWCNLLAKWEIYHVWFFPFIS